MADSPSSAPVSKIANQSRKVVRTDAGSGADASAPCHTPKGTCSQGESKRAQKSAKVEATKDKKMIQSNRRRSVEARTGKVQLWKDEGHVHKLLRYGIISNVVVDNYIHRKHRTGNGRLNVRDRLYLFMYSPSSSRTALGYAILIMALNLVSLTLVAMHSLEPWASGGETVLLAIEYSLSGIYAIELLLRFICCPTWYLFLADVCPSLPLPPPPPSPLVHHACHTCMPPLCIL
eukprot:2964392-Prymnesium_polylepis.1